MQLVVDAANGLMGLLDSAAEGELTQMLVLDAQDAFWEIPLHPSERRFYCGRIRTNNQDRYLCYLRTAQGSRGAPLSWAVLFSLMSRCVLSTLRETRRNSSSVCA